MAAWGGRLVLGWCSLGSLALRMGLGDGCKLDEVMWFGWTSCSTRFAVLEKAMHALRLFLGSWGSCASRQQYQIDWEEGGLCSPRTASLCTGTWNHRAKKKICN